MRAGALEDGKVVEGLFDGGMGNSALFFFYRGPGQDCLS